MADLSFSRNTKIFVEQVDESEVSTTFWEIPVLDGYSFSQSTNTSEITLNEMANSAAVSRRGKAIFTDSLSPTEWSFSTYMRPNTSTPGSCVEEMLWAKFLANTNYVAPNWTKSDYATQSTFVDKSTANQVRFDTSQSNVSALGTFNLYFVLGGCGVEKVSNSYDFSNLITYKIKDCAVNTASIDFEIDGIAMINWSGFGGQITEISDFTPGKTGIDEVYIGTIIDTGVSSTSNFIRNRLTQLRVAANNTDLFPGLNYAVSRVSGNTVTAAGHTFSNDELVTLSGFTDPDLTILNDRTYRVSSVTTDTFDISVLKTYAGDSYQVQDADPSDPVISVPDTTDTGVAGGLYRTTLTGGNITFENNISYLTPEELCKVNQPIEHVTGTRTVTGNFTCYLDKAGDGEGSADLFNNMTAEDAQTEIRNYFVLEFLVGGSDLPKVEFLFENAHIEVPNHSIEDIISLDVTFHALQSNLTSEPDEAIITYKGKPA